MSEHLSPRAAERRFYLLTTTRWLPVGFVVGIFILVQTGRGLSIAQAATVGSVIFVVGGWRLFTRMETRFADYI